jgi:hypothetical protein
MHLTARQPDGATLGDHLRAASRNTGRTDSRLLERPPLGGEELWQVYVALNAARPAGMAPGAVPPSEIEAWCRLHAVPLTPWEAETLMTMDRAALKVLASQRPAPKKSGKGH